MSPATEVLCYPGDVQRVGRRSPDHLNVAVQGNEDEQALWIEQIAQLVSQGRNLIRHSLGPGTSDHDRDSVKHKRLSPFQQAVVEAALLGGDWMVEEVRGDGEIRPILQEPGAASNVAWAGADIGKGAGVLVDHEKKQCGADDIRSQACLLQAF